MRLPLYILFNTAAMLSTLVTCQTLKDAQNLRSLASDLLRPNSEIQTNSVILALNTMLNRIDPASQPITMHEPYTLEHYSEYNRGVVHISVVLYPRRNRTHPERILYETTRAMVAILAGDQHAGFDILEDSISNDTKLGLSDQPIMKALELRSSANAYITSQDRNSVDDAKLSKLLNSIYPDEQWDIENIPSFDTLMNQCSGVVDRSFELHRNGIHSKRIAIESLKAFLECYRGDAVNARSLLNGSIDQDNDEEITGELREMTEKMREVPEGWDVRWVQDGPDPRLSSMYPHRFRTCQDGNKGQHWRRWSKRKAAKISGSTSRESNVGETTSGLDYSDWCGTARPEKTRQRGRKSEE
jgi:hypothetical protein